MKIRGPPKGPPPLDPHLYLGNDRSVDRSRRLQVCNWLLCAELFLPETSVRYSAENGSRESTWGVSEVVVTSFHYGMLNPC